MRYSGIFIIGGILFLFIGDIFIWDAPNNTIDLIKRLFEFFFYG